MEDIAAADIERCRSILGSDYFSELHRANGLASHGIGIGSFVYLRRIFERLILQHHDLLKADGKEVEGFDRMRVDEKIIALAAVLPPALVKHKAAYSILSRGLHELDEDTCKRFFPVVRAAIISILEEDLQAQEKEKAAENLEREMARITSEIKKGG